MTIRHHLSDQLLMAYAAGRLPEAFSLVVATHLSLCDDCRAQAGSFDALGGALLEEAGESAMGEDALAQALARIEGLPQARTEGPKPAGIFPAPLAGHVGGGPDAVRWRRVGGGVKQAILPTGKGATARLLFIPAGMAVPDHGHRGMELTLVLQGAFADRDESFGPGDVEISDETVEHTPTVLAGQDCICLAATDAPLRFRGLIARLAQPFLRI
ncbi:ChrR family anti-sigma-E factor [Tabrizicola sp.]|uniref:ChrR family anti-sigma-E factor n=1 Tax=Tabrizicola sp. TaxID=2005166 RepID=UPI001A5C63A7|nr:ChrR family anti-sigma-E factor [Tabrizicola sp.]MBL9073578.1 cupin domain-containing protein [Tabrizicola sp.]